MMPILISSVTHHALSPPTSIVKLDLVDYGQRPLARVIDSQGTQLIALRDLNTILRAKPITAIHIITPLKICRAEPARAATAIGFLRECTSMGVPVHWNATAIDVDIRPSLRHLHPPASIRAESRRTDLAAWTAQFRFGAFYFRRGPGFVIVIDTRLESDAHRYVVDDDRLVQAFAAGLWPQDEQVNSPDSISLLEGEGLMITLGTVSVILPYRIGRWPIPYNSI
jgi:hypothetical protein